jgi:endonuclease/exonuclease/phosphatase family metal-dependent hydrolase
MKVMTLNLAHGRGQKWHQWLLDREAIEANLTSIAAVLCRESPDVVALQEADGPSFWSGGFDHIAHLAEAAGYPHLVRGEHVQRRRLVYGTSLLSRIPIHEALSVTFPRSLPTTTKGFVVGRVVMPDRSGMKIDVASVHLDFLRPAIRRRQIAQIVASLRHRHTPQIILGDFNCSWRSRDRCLHRLADELDLTTYDPSSRHLWTFSRLHRRLDWIFVSSEIRFLSYRVLPDRLSDHRAVVADLV